MRLTTAAAPVRSQPTSERLPGSSHCPAQVWASSPKKRKARQTSHQKIELLSKYLNIGACWHACVSLSLCPRVSYSTYFSPSFFLIPLLFLSFSVSLLPFRLHASPCLLLFGCSVNLGKNVEVNDNVPSKPQVWTDTVPREPFLTHAFQKARVWWRMFSAHANILHKPLKQLLSICSEIDSARPCLSTRSAKAQGSPPCRDTVISTIMLMARRSTRKLKVSTKLNGFQHTTTRTSFWSQMPSAPCPNGPNNQYSQIQGLHTYMMCLYSICA